MVLEDDAAKDHTLAEWEMRTSNSYMGSDAMMPVSQVVAQPSKHQTTHTCPPQPNVRAFIIALLPPSTPFCCRAPLTLSLSTECVIYYHLGQFQRQSYIFERRYIRPRRLLSSEHRTNAQRMGLTLLWRCNDSLMCPSPNRRGSSFSRRRRNVYVRERVCLYMCGYGGV